MERTLEDIQRDFEKAKTELEPIVKEYNKAIEKKSELEDEMENYKLQHGLYHPMSDLLEHKGKEIYFITLVIRNDDGTLVTKEMYNDEMFSVDEKGHLDYSSYNNGIMFYEEKKEKYSYMYHYRETLYDFVGYLEVEFREDDEE